MRGLGLATRGLSESPFVLFLIIVAVAAIVITSLIEQRNRRK